jgi:hypothetical protein
MGEGLIPTLTSMSRRLFALEQWCIGWAKLDIERFLAAPETARFPWIKPGPARELLADPFGIEIEGRPVIFAERLVLGRHAGRIVRIDPDRIDAPVREVLAAPHHLSYPFIVAEGERSYLVPEQGESGVIAFHPIKDGLPAERVAVLAPFGAIDPTFLFHDGCWWLFCTRPEEPNAALHLYFSDRLFGPYQAHPDNPVIRDPAQARPAGQIIARGGKLIRPAQDCAQTYGGAIVLCEIEVLTRSAYRERIIGRIAPRSLAGGFDAGAHTLSHTENYVFVDTKRFAPAVLAAPIKLAARLGVSL